MPEWRISTAERLRLHRNLNDILYSHTNLLNISSAVFCTFDPQSCGWMALAFNSSCYEADREPRSQRRLPASTILVVVEWMASAILANPTSIGLQQRHTSLTAKARPLEIGTSAIACLLALRIGFSAVAWRS